MEEGVLKGDGGVMGVKEGMRGSLSVDEEVYGRFLCLDEEIMKFWVIIWREFWNLSLDCC